MARKKALTNEEILVEIERLKASPYVEIAKENQKLRNKLYQLRHLEKVGKEIASKKK